MQIAFIILSFFGNTTVTFDIHIHILCLCMPTSLMHSVKIDWLSIVFGVWHPIGRGFILGMLWQSTFGIVFDEQGKREWKLWEPNRIYQDITARSSMHVSPDLFEFIFVAPKGNLRRGNESLWLNVHTQKQYIYVIHELKLRSFVSPAFLTTWNTTFYCDISSWFPYNTYNILHLCIYYVFTWCTSSEAREWRMNACHTFNALSWFEYTSTCAHRQPSLLSLLSSS